MFDGRAPWRPTGPDREESGLEARRATPGPSSPAAETCRGACEGDAGHAHDLASLAAVAAAATLPRQRRRLRRCSFKPTKAGVDRDRPRVRRGGRSPRRGGLWQPARRGCSRSSPAPPGSRQRVPPRRRCASRRPSACAPGRCPAPCSLQQRQRVGFLAREGVTAEGMVEVAVQAFQGQQRVREGAGLLVRQASRRPRARSACRPSTTPG